jgi:hypothetical protein
MNWPGGQIGRAPTVRTSIRITPTRRASPSIASAGPPSWTTSIGSPTPPTSRTAQPPRSRRPAANSAPTSRRVTVQVSPLHGHRPEQLRPNGDSVQYDPESDIFGVLSADGFPRTYFRPDPSEHGFLTNLDYFNDHPSYCRVCGFEPPSPPWGPTGTDPSWELCPCCGVEHGYEDASEAGVLRYRSRWLELGAPWSDPSVPEDSLTVDARLARVLGSFGNPTDRR